MRAIIWICALALSLAALSNTASAETYRINNEVWGWYQKYLGRIGDGRRPGAFVITEDGQNAWYTYCPDTQCMGGLTYSQDALNSCEREYDMDCVVFAVRDDIRVEYEIEKSAPAAADQSAMAPQASGVAKLRISSALREDVERYLRNSDSFGSSYYRYLALSHAGDKIGTSNCKKMTTWLSDGCAGMNNPQEGAKRVALQACGNPNECRLIFEGSTKIGVFEIEWY
jgi:hypothetical protein